MKNLLFQGVYDTKTFEKLRQLGVQDFSFDLRPQSPNLITFKTVKEILELAKMEKFFLHFSQENREIIRSYKNLLSHYPHQLTTVMSDNSELSHLAQMDDFYWMFHPLSDWQNILRLKHLKGVFLPLVFQDFYKNESNVWNIVEARNLDVYLHASNFEQAQGLEFDHDLKLSIDLNREVESSYRKVDMEKLNRLNIRSLMS